MDPAVDRAGGRVHEDLGGAHRADDIACPFDVDLSREAWLSVTEGESNKRGQVDDGVVPTDLRAELVGSGHVAPHDSSSALEEGHARCLAVAEGVEDRDLVTFFEQGAREHAPRETRAAGHQDLDDEPIRVIGWSHSSQRLVSIATMRMSVIAYTVCAVPAGKCMQSPAATFRKLSLPSSRCST